MAAKIIVRGLLKRYGSLQAVDGITFDVQSGEIFGLLGPNGAGKTTTIECMLGLRQPEAGAIEICGLDIRWHPQKVKQRIGATLQTNALHDKITPREALKLFGSFYRLGAEPDALLDRFSLSDKADAMYDRLSGGQQQRLALALAFVNQPEVLFLDEPTAGLDPATRRELHADIRRMKEERRSVLLTTHYMDEAEKLCDRVAIIDRGRILAIGTPRALIAQSKTAPSVHLETSRPVEFDCLALLPHVRDLTCEGSSARFRTGNVTRTLAGLMKLLNTQDADLTALHVQNATLEDVFIELTGRSLRAGAASGPANSFKDLRN